MDEPTTLLWDVGGVLATNGWDKHARQRAAETFGYDPQPVEARHDAAFPAFETGQRTLKEYLDETVFFVPRRFGRTDYRNFMLRQSVPHPETLGLARSVARRKRYLMAAFNNEGRELNEFRIERFRLRDIFSLFLSSCYLGHRKPEAQAYRQVVDLLQRDPRRILFIDDRPENLAPARRLGFHTIRYRRPAQLSRAFAQAGIQVAAD
jgi:putative hydrolase of the HAD superfamily